MNERILSLVEAASHSSFKCLMVSRMQDLTSDIVSELRRDRKHQEKNNIQNRPPCVFRAWLNWGVGQNRLCEKEKHNFSLEDFLSCVHA